MRELRTYVFYSETVLIVILVWVFGKGSGCGVTDQLSSCSYLSEECSFVVQNRCHGDGKALEQAALLSISVLL